MSNRSHITKNNIICGFIISFLAILTTAGHADPIVADRIIVDIGAQRYTQRAIEVSTLVKEALSNQKPINFASMGLIAEKWPRILDEFVIEALIDQEAIKLGSFQPTDKEILDAVAEVQKKIASHSDWENYSQKLKLDASRIRYSVLSFFRIKTYCKRESDKKNEQGIKDLCDFSDLQNKFFTDLRSNHLIRYYDARIYSPISP